MKNALQEDDVISKEIALQEIKEFVEKHTYKEIDNEKLEEDYYHALLAVRKGLLVFEEGKPKLTLLVPILSVDGNVVLDTINFKTRFKPTQLASMMNGTNTTKKMGDYMIRFYNFICNLDSKEYLGKLDRFDYKVVEQVCGVFF